MTDTPGCSRCGTTTGQHSAKCLQAMALAWAMGVEERPRVGPVRVEPDPLVDDLRAEISQLSLTKRALDEAVAALERERVGASQLEEEVSRLHAEMDLLGEKLLAAQAEVERLRQERAEWDRPQPAPVTQLPPGYYDRLDRLAEIDAEIESPAFQRELAEMAASADLEVEVHDEANATIRPKRDDDYTEAGVNATTVDEMRQWAQDQAIEAALSPAPDKTDWAAFIRELRGDRTHNQFGALLGCSHQSVRDWETGKVSTPAPKWQEKLRALAATQAVAGPAPAPEFPATKPETIAAREATEQWVREHVRTADKGTRTDEKGRTWQRYITSPEALEAYLAWAVETGAVVNKRTRLDLGTALGAVTPTKRQGPVHGGQKPMCYFGIEVDGAATTTEVEDAPAEKAPVGDVGAGAAAPEPAAEPEKPQVTPADLDPRERNKRDVEELRALMKASTSRVEETPLASVTPPPGPDEMAIKLAQLKHFGIGGVEGVSKDAARAAVADLHPTGRDVWTSVPGEGWSDSDLEATAYQLLVKCMDGLPEEIGFDYKEDVLATAGFVEEDVIAAVRSPQRVEIRPESWDKEKRYPILGFTRGDVQVIVGMLTPTKPRVIAAYWQALLQADSYRVNRHGGGGSRKATGLPTNPGTSLSRLAAMGVELDGDPLKDKAVKVVYKGQDLGKITCGRAVAKATVQSDYQRTLRKIQAIDRREEAKAG